MADRVVIMSNGKIAQTGIPRDIYRAPANRFVAEFVGRNNIIAGKVTSVIGQTVQIDSPIGQFTVIAEAEAPAPQDEITFVIAADLVEVSRSQPIAENVVAASLISEEFIGSVVTLFLETDDGTELKVQLQERELATLDHASGGRFHLSWNSASAHALPQQ